MENQPSSFNQEESEIDSNAKILTYENIKLSSTPISCPQSSALTELRAAPISKENKCNGHWTLEKIKIVPYPQPDFQITNENLNSGI